MKSGRRKRYNTKSDGMKVLKGRELEEIESLLSEAITTVR
jgi:hypothetical protein